MEPGIMPEPVPAGRAVSHLAMTFTPALLFPRQHKADERRPVGFGVGTLNNTAAQRGCTGTSAGDVLPQFSGTMVGDLI